MKASGITIKDMEWGLKDLLTVIFMRDSCDKFSVGDSYVGEY